MFIAHNIAALNAHRNLNVNTNKMSKSLSKLTSGMRINSAGDDAAGLAISEKMRGQIRGLNQASRNTQDTISLIQTAEGGLNEIQNIYQRARELSVQAANDTYTLPDRDNIRGEVYQILQQSDMIAATTEFNGKKLLDGSFSGTFQIGANSGQTVSVDVKPMTVFDIVADTYVFDGTIGNFGVNSGTILPNCTVFGSQSYLDINNKEILTDNISSELAIHFFDIAIEGVSKARAQLGAIQNRLEHTIKVDDNSSENLLAAESRIRDVDMASEMLTFTKDNILAQAAQAMLAQANNQPQNILQLLR